MRKGFTLVELLAVIVILAIILAIAIPGISNIINSSTRGAAESDAKMILDVIKIKSAEDSNFDSTTINETNVESLLGISDDNYERLTIKKMNGQNFITTVGKNKWNNLTVSGTKTNTKVSDTVTDFVRGANAPALVTGMTPIKWNGSAWVTTTTDDTAWYNYDTTNKIWANAKTADGSMWVWIPRYIYKIPTVNWHTNTAGTIDIQFTKGVDDNWNKAVIGSIDLGETANASNNKWTNHPAFTFGDTELTGIWVAKFEASSTNPELQYGGGTTSGLKVKTVPNVVSWRGMVANNMCDAAKAMETDSTYGWGTTSSGLDTHLMKNVEWGAVAYLTQSIYGKNAEVWKNPSDTLTTGCAGDSASSAITTGCLRTYDTANGQQASTTGNIYGIYDMAGGTWEYLAAYANSSYSSSVWLNKISNADAKYKDMYQVSTTDTDINNYAIAINHKGEALYETSGSYSGSTSWYSDDSSMVRSTQPILMRGGSYAYTSSSGLFNFNVSGGGAYSGQGYVYGFRPVLLVGSGL